MQDQEIPDPYKIEEALNVILSTQNDLIRKEANDYLRYIEQNYPNILLSLIFIYENNQLQISKLQSLLLIKNIIVRNWIKATIINKKKVNNISEELKSTIRSKVIEFLQISTEQKEKDIIDLIVQAIGKYDFPAKFLELENYFLLKLQKIISSGCNIDSDLLNVMTTLNKVQKEVQKNKLSILQSQVYSGIQSIIISIYLQNIDYLYQYLVEHNTIALPMQTSKKMDKLLSNIAIFFNQEDNIIEIQDIFMALLHKSGWILQQEVKSLNQESHLKTIVSGLVNLQCTYPIGVSQALKEYIMLLNLIIGQNWKEIKVMKISLIGLNQILQTYCYYCSQEQFKCLIPQPKTQRYVELRLLASQICNQFFSENIQLLLQTLIKINVQERNEDQELQDGQSKEVYEKANIHSSISTLCYQCQQQLILRFSDLVQNYLTINVAQLLQSDHNSINFLILDSFLALLNRLIQVTNKSHHSITILPILQYLLNLNTSDSYTRYLQLSVSYMPFAEFKEQEMILNQLIILATKENSLKIKHLAQICIYSIVKMNNFSIQDLNSSLLVQISSILITLLLADEISPDYQTQLHLLGKILKLLLQNEKSLNELNDFIRAIKLDKLIFTQSELLIEALSEMFKSLILSYPFGSYLPNIYYLIILLIENNLKRQSSNVLNLFLILLFEYDETKDLNLIGFNLKDLFNSLQNFLFYSTDRSIIEIVYRLTEELVLLNLIPISTDLFNLITNQLQFATQIADHDEQIDIYTRCLSILEAIVLKQFDSLELVNYYSLIIYLAKLMISLQGKKIQTFQQITCQNLIIKILNRFILKDVNAIFHCLNNNQVSYDSYLLLSLEQSKHLRNKGDKKVNAAAFLLSIKNLQKQNFYSALNLFLEECLAEIYFDIELKNDEYVRQEKENKYKFQTAIQTRTNHKRESFRKEFLQEMCLLDQHFDLKKLFFSQCQVWMEVFGFSELSQIVVDQKVRNNMHILLDEC